MAWTSRDPCKQTQRGILKPFKLDSQSAMHTDNCTHGMSRAGNSYTLPSTACMVYKTNSRQTDTQTDIQTETQTDIHLAVNILDNITKQSKVHQTNLNNLTQNFLSSVSSIGPVQFRLNRHITK